MGGGTGTTAGPVKILTIFVSPGSARDLIVQDLLVLDFLVDDDGTARFWMFRMNDPAKVESLHNRKMVSDNNGGFTPKIFLINKREGSPSQWQAIKPVVWRYVLQTTQDENRPFWSTLSAS